jgi:hypothetical protein
MPDSQFVATQETAPAPDDREARLHVSPLPQITAALEQAGIAYKILDWSDEMPPAVLVNASDRRRFMRVFLQHPEIGLSSLKAAAGILGFSFIAPRTVILRRRHARVLELPIRVIFYEMKGGEALLLRKNILTNSLPADWIENANSVFATPYPMRNALRELDAPVDFVFTWVNGKDPAWRARKQHAAGAPELKKDMTVDSLSEGRWDSFDELRYALRSVAANAPWVRKIFLVTDQQRPEWLQETPRLQVIDHADIFAPYCKRPTFNSHVIESQLHRIPGLAEHYVYLNDDFIILKTIMKFDFFLRNGIATFHDSSSKIDLSPTSGRDNAPTAAGKRMREMLGLGSRLIAVNKMRHCPYPMHKSLMQEIEKEFASDFDYLGKQQFRSQGDFAPVSQLYPYYAFMKGRSAPGRLENVYWDLYKPLDLKSRFVMAFNLADVMCLNASDGDDRVLRRNQRKAKRMLERLFPLPSEFEKPVGT